MRPRRWLVILAGVFVLALGAAASAQTGDLPEPPAVEDVAVDGADQADDLDADEADVDSDQGENEDSDEADEADVDGSGDE